ncbi:MAG: glycosyltransferase family 39 protein [Anaerolineae bacterium]|nr:glycosyltransferase family 39 protein [Anaerolineae bacterium]MDW8100081.1 glycosyltransferase family 39 protein [Anaerolineae bacterium]
MPSEFASHLTVRLVRPWLWALFITLGAAWLRFWALERIPPGYHFDEAFEGLEAWKVLSLPGYRPIFFPGNFGVEPAFIYLTSLAFSLAGATPTVQRAVAAAVGSLTIPALYALGRELEQDGAPSGTALLAALALGISYWHLTFSRVGIEPILVPLTICLALWALWRGMRTGESWAFLVAGLSVGLGPYTYPAGRLIPFLYALALIGLGVFKRSRLQVRWQGVALSWIVAALTFAPLAVHWARHPELLLLRSAQVAVIPGQAPGSLGDNLLRTLGMFSIAGDMDPRSNLPGRPALDGWIALWFYVGIGVALARWRRPAWSLPLWWSLVMVLPTVFSEFAPHFRRSIGAAPAVSLLIGLGAAWTWHRALTDRPSQFWSSLPMVLMASLIPITFLGSSSLTVRDYFVRWGALPDLYYAYDVGLWDMGRYAAKFPEEELVYLTPRPATHTTLAFAWRGRRSPVTFDGRSVFPFRPGAPTPQHYLVIEHEDFRTPMLIRDLFPSVEVVRDFRDRAGRVYARHYLVPARAAPRPVTRQIVNARWPGVTLTSYSLLPSKHHPGDVLYVRLLWTVDDPPPSGDWTTFVHLLDLKNPTHALVAADSRPGGGSYPTDRWQPGQWIVDEYQLRLPRDLAPGPYAVEIGFYTADGRRLPVQEANGALSDHVILGPFKVAEP